VSTAIACWRRTTSFIPATAIDPALEGGAHMGLAAGLWEAGYLQNTCHLRWQAVILTIAKDPEVFFVGIANGIEASAVGIEFRLKIFDSSVDWLPTRRPLLLVQDKIPIRKIVTELNGSNPSKGVLVSPSG
jgi:hypothetical protein